MRTYFNINKLKCVQNISIDVINKYLKLICTIERWIRLKVNNNISIANKNKTNNKKLKVLIFWNPCF